MLKVEGKNLEDALKNAAEKKGVTVEDLKYFVIEEKAAGLFGIGGKTTIEVYTMGDIQQFIEDYLQTYFRNLNMDAEVTVTRNEDNSFKVVVNGDNNAILIGKNGQTLEAIKNVVNAAANAQFKCHVYMTVDINGYKEERYEKLKATVERIARTVVKTRVSARLRDLTSDERKIVHQHLNGMAHIRTESEGDGSNRRLKIIYDENK
ncbi:MAG: KH domain-containing protein [Erysipelotrichaceae bacterium]|nr:KH domain-containing protein [Erysipelotrichaceae bacterium]